jgi:hypothetical protein
VCVQANQSAWLWQTLAYYEICPFFVHYEYVMLYGSGAGSMLVAPGNTKGGSIYVPLASCLTGLELAA